MANTLFISEFSAGLSSIGTEKARVLPQPSVKDQVVAIGGASVQSAVFQPSTTVVRLVADASCSIAFGVHGAGGVAAVVTNLLLPANTPMDFAVQPNNNQCVAVIANA